MMDRIADSLHQLELEAVSLIEARQLVIQRRYPCAGTFVDLFIEGADANQSRVSMAILIRPWLENTWSQVVSYADREVKYFGNMKAPLFVKILVPGNGVSPAPLITLEGLSGFLSTWFPPAAYNLRQVNADDSVARRVAFCAMPFHQDFLDVYLLGILPAAKEAGFNVNRLDQTFNFTGITQRIWSGISNADLTIADISGHNPNVMYEVGLAQGLGCRTFVIRDSTTDIPFDIRDTLILTYDRKKLHRLQQDLVERLGQAGVW